MDNLGDPVMAMNGRTLAGKWWHGMDVAHFACPVCETGVPYMRKAGTNSRWTPMSHGAGLVFRLRTDGTDEAARCWQCSEIDPCKPGPFLGADNDLPVPPLDFRGSYGPLSQTAGGDLRKPSGEKEVLKFILDPFKPHEHAQLKQVFKRVSQALETIVLDGPEKAMNQFNG